MARATTTVRYTGVADSRSFSAEDFSRHGIEQGDVVFDHDNRWMNEVTPEAGGYLIGIGEFVKISAEEKKERLEETKPVQQVPFPEETPEEPDTSEEETPS